jgi:nitroreductase
MELMEIIKGRRSIRNYKPDIIPQETIRDILEAGIWAPSAKDGQQWRFTVLTGESKDNFQIWFRGELNKFVDKHGEREIGSALWTCGVMDQAPVVVIVWNAGKNDWITEEHSVAAAIQNILLRAYELGLGSLWIGDVYYAYDGIREYFDKPWKLSGAITLGYTIDKGRIPEKKSVNEVTEFLT